MDQSRSHVYLNVCEVSSRIAEFSKQHEVLPLTGWTGPSLCLLETKMQRCSHARALKCAKLAGVCVQMATDDQMSHRS